MLLLAASVTRPPVQYNIRCHRKRLRLLFVVVGFRKGWGDVFQVLKGSLSLATR